MPDLSVVVQVAILVTGVLVTVIKHDRSALRLLLNAVALFGKDQRARRARELLESHKEGKSKK